MLKTIAKNRPYRTLAAGLVGSPGKIDALDELAEASL
jgi:hypothetical protein